MNRAEGTAMIERQVVELRAWLARAKQERAALTDLDSEQLRTYDDTIREAEEALAGAEDLLGGADPIA